MIAVLLTVHNRREKTLACLRALYASRFQDDGDKADTPHLFDVFLVDDGSTDRTAEAVREAFPAVQIIAGDGTLFWNRGMRRAWESAATTRDYDHYLWLNDDTLLGTDAVQTLLDTSRAHDDKAIVVGTTSATDDASRITYGGRTKAGLVWPASHVQDGDGNLSSAHHATCERQCDGALPCDFFNGNIVLVPRSVFRLVGMHDKAFRHALGDFDYGLRARKQGIELLVAPGVAGTCDMHDALPTWCRSSTPLSQRFKAMRKGPVVDPEEFFFFNRRHFGFGKACRHYLSQHIRMLFPKLWEK